MVQNSERKRGPCENSDPQEPKEYSAIKKEFTVKHDLIILGAGPAGLTASIYANRAAVNALTIEQGNYGGQMNLTHELDNFPGFEKISGAELSAKMHEHAVSLGCKFEFDIIQSIEKMPDRQGFLLKSSLKTYECKALILATGATARPAGFSGEDTYVGHGVSYCATCDGFFFKGKICYVLGGGNSACLEADFLTRFAKKVIMVVRKDHFRATASHVERVTKNPKIEILYNTSVTELAGDGQAASVITLRNNLTNETKEEIYEPGSFGVFVFTGFIPNSALITHLVKTGEGNEIITDEKMETSVPGLFAAGDVREKLFRQVITAASDGATAATSAALFLGKSK